MILTSIFACLLLTGACLANPVTKEIDAETEQAALDAVKEVAIAVADALLALANKIKAEASGLDLDMDVRSAGQWRERSAEVAELQRARKGSTCIGWADPKPHICFSWGS